MLVLLQALWLKYAVHLRNNQTIRLHAPTLKCHAKAVYCLLIARVLAG